MLFHVITAPPYQYVLYCSKMLDYKVFVLGNAGLHY